MTLIRLGSISGSCPTTIGRPRLPLTRCAPIRKLCLTASRTGFWIPLGQVLREIYSRVSLKHADAFARGVSPEELGL